MILLFASLIIIISCPLPRVNCQFHTNFSHDFDEKVQ
jgi:hypothetical protein